jgi:hypothetical protein
VSISRPLIRRSIRSKPPQAGRSELRPQTRKGDEIFTISGGRVIREQAFFDHAEALEAAGLLE